MQSNLQYYTVAAPISGIVEQRNIDLFDMVAPQVPTFVISNKDAMTISFQVSETTWENTRIGDIVQIAKNGSSCDGTVTEISTMVGTVNGLYTIKVSVENAPFNLNTGTSIKVFAQMQKADNAYTLPIDAVYFENGSAYVYTYDNGIARKIDVVTGIADAENIEIVSGLTLNDRVIITWNASMMDSMEVILLEETQSESDTDIIITEEGTQSGVSEQSDEQAASLAEIEINTEESDGAIPLTSSDVSLDAAADDSGASQSGGDVDHE
jgi:RND family efflux transporter MFP subunit